MAVVIAATVLLLWRAINPPTSFEAEPSAVAAFRIPTTAMSNLYSLSNANSAPFDQILTMYAVTNNFFAQYDESPIVEFDLLYENYVYGFNQLRRRYASRDVRPYFEMFKNLTNELVHFPVPSTHEYTFHDTWENSRGTVILDLMNTRERIPVSSMTPGEISHAAWHSNQGYYVVVATESGNRIIYTQLDNLADGMKPGMTIVAGQQLGYMGTHLHISINVKPYADDFWINPYPFLRHLETLRILNV